MKGTAKAHASVPKPASLNNAGAMEAVLSSANLTISYIHLHQSLGSSMTLSHMTASVAGDDNGGQQ